MSWSWHVLKSKNMSATYFLAGQQPLFPILPQHFTAIMACFVLPGRPLPTCNGLTLLHAECFLPCFEFVRNPEAQTKYWNFHTGKLTTISPCHSETIFGQVKRCSNWPRFRRIMYLFAHIFWPTSKAEPFGGDGTPRMFQGQSLFFTVTSNFSN